MSTSFIKGLIPETAVVKYLVPLGRVLISIANNF